MYIKECIYHAVIPVRKGYFPEKWHRPKKRDWKGIWKAVCFYGSVPLVTGILWFLYMVGFYLGGA